MDFSTDIKYIKGVGEVIAGLFNKLGIFTVGDLLFNFPRDYEDWSRITPIMETEFGVNCCIRARITNAPEGSRTRGGAMIFKAVATDGNGLLMLTFFNNKYVVNQLFEGQEYLFFGKINQTIVGGREMLSPRFVKASDNDKIHPVYRQTEKLTTKKIEAVVSNALSALRGGIEETLPEYLIIKYRLMGLEESIRNMHFPENDEQLRLARRRLVFEELLGMQLGLIFLREKSRSSTSVRIQHDKTQDFYDSLPYSPTNAQKRCISECVEDMKTSRPMNRLLQGDVGSGKTTVAAALIHNAVENGYQCALMVPTEVLAEQHFKSLSKLFGDRINISLLTGSVKAAEKKKIKSALAEGKTDLVVGTHAIISDDVQFKKLGFVITDEQHRFGVNQRTALAKKGLNPHTLVMSATPIPRTLGLIIYGDLDISVIDELPKGRQPIETYCVGPEYRERLYKFIKKHIDEGRQGYVICPLVEEGETETDLIPAQEYAEYLQKEVFVGYNVGLLHGKMKPKQKDEIMRQFADGEIQLLVSTVVVEVGIDVPNAAVMMIENAERFGLSQLHQLRGRIGRGQFKSTCVLVSGAQNEDSRKRLDVMCRTTDGFVIAEEDLKQRGPGDFLGSRQHGLPEMKLANIVSDTKILYAAQKQAEDILFADPELTLPEHRKLRQTVEKMFGRFGDVGIN
ncbi:MAG: ATP-dependent DNA helicase RecG [Clostridia bacterium]|nr:ATP-dependent DNA helicase RecG [Clostridia bacterium]